MYDPKKIYNITEEEMRAIQERANMRDALKKEFQQKVSNPYRGVGGYIVSDLHPVCLRYDMNRCEQMHSPLAVKLLLHAQVNSAFCPQRDSELVVAYALRGEGLVWLIGVVVHLLAADHGSNIADTSNGWLHSVLWYH